MDETDVSTAVRRRRWSLEGKRAVVAMSLEPDCSMGEIATCFDLAPNQVYAWRWGRSAMRGYGALLRGITEVICV